MSVALDWALAGGLVHRDASSAPEPLAIGIKDGAIAFLGPQRDLAPGVVVRNLQGQHVYPGFADAHGHLYHLGSRLEEVRLEETRSLAEAVSRVRVAVNLMPRDAWVVGGGWDESLWAEGRGPTSADLEEAVGGRPACLLRRDCHAVWVSGAALALANIEEVEGGRVERDAGGKPSGVLVDRAMDLVTRVIPAPDPVMIRRRLLAATRACAAGGLTAVHDMGVDAATLAVLRNLDREGSLPIRVHAALRDVPALWEQEFARGPQVPPAGGRLAVRAVKLFADGALGSRGAAMFEDYADDAGNRGLPLISGGELRDRLTRATRAGYQCCVHAIGDRANHEVLDAFEALAAGPDGAAFRALRPRVEHAQVLSEPDVPRFATLGVIASVQPVHAASDQRWAESRLGRERARFAYAFGSLQKAGARLAFGSDFPVETYDLREGMMAATTRAALGGGETSWHTEERVSSADTIAAYTSGPAYASFGEGERGKVAEGYLADFTIWDRDLAEDLRASRVVATIVGGKVEHLAPGTR
jgi:predicted amidohydrolase YtcJ